MMDVGCFPAHEVIPVLIVFGCLEIIILALTTVATCRGIVMSSLIRLTAAHYGNGLNDTLGTFLIQITMI